MKQVTDTFKNKIKSTVRICDVKLEFAFGQTPFTLTGEDIQGIKYTSEMKRELGGIEEQILTIKIMKNQVPLDAIDTQINVKVYIGVANEWCQVGKFITDYWGKADNKGVVTVECKDVLKQLCDKNMPFIPTMIGSSKKEYLSKINNSLGITCSTDELHDGKLSMAMLKGTKVGDTLGHLLFAMNGIARGRESIEYIPFKIKSTSQESLTYNDMLYSVEGVKDGTLEYDLVNVCVYLPSGDEYKEVAKLTDLKVPANHNNYRIGSVVFSEPKITKCISFDREVIIRDFNISTDKISIDIDNPESIGISLNVKVDGSNLQDTNVSNSDDTENKIKNVQSIYIQDAESVSTIDTRIYTSKEFKAKYRGLPYIEVGDTVLIEDVGNVLVTYHELTYTGVLGGYIKGVLIGG